MNELEKKTEDKIKDYLDMQVIYDTFWYSDDISEDSNLAFSDFVYSEET
jgi:hypothetical protein